MLRTEIGCSKILKQIETAVGAAKIGLDIIDSKYNIRYIDPAWKKVYGDPAGKKCYRYFMRRNSICPHCGVREAFRTKKITVKEEVLTKEGNKPIQVTTVPFKDGGEWLVAETNINITDIKNAERVLSESEHKYRMLFEDSNDAIIIADAKTRRLVDCNKKALEMTGYSRQKILSMRVDQLHMKNTKQIAMEAFRRMLAGKTAVVEAEVLTRSGKAVAVSISGTLFSAGGKLCIMGVFRDISERKKVDEMMRESENKYKLLFEESNDAILVADARTRKIIDCNKKAQEMTGYPKYKLLSMRADDLHPKELVRQTMEGFNRQAAGLTKIVDSQVLTRNMGRIDVLISATALEIGGRKILIASFRDITERKKAEDAVRLSEERYSAIAESASDAIFIIDRKHRFAYLNSYCAKTLGRKRSDIIGRRLKKVFQPGASRGPISNTRKVFKSGKPMLIVEKIMLPGGWRWLDTRLAPIKDRNGKVIYVAGIARDITLQKKADEVLRRDRQELEGLVQSRSAELLRVQNELHRAKRLSDVGRLAATVAHELRSPFAAIRTAGYNIKMKSKDPRLESHLANIDKKILEADQIIKNLLYYSSIKPPHRENFYFCRMMDECVELSRQIFRGHKVSIKRICKCGRNFMIEGDLIQLKEVFNNLLNNSYESFSGKKGRIEIKTQTGKRYINIRIKDNGPGIDPKDRQKIFEPFFTTKVRGMGLGLPLCSQIISLHNGTIKMTSRPGKGTVVEVRLPLRSKVEKSQKKVA